MKNKMVGWFDVVIVFIMGIAITTCVWSYNAKAEDVRNISDYEFYDLDFKEMDKLFFEEVIIENRGYVKEDYIFDYNGDIDESN